MKRGFPTKLRWLLGGLMLATLSCQLVLGLDEPVTAAAADAGASNEASTSDAGNDASFCAHVDPPSRPDASGDGNTEKDFWFATTALELPISNPELPQGIDLDNVCTSCDTDGGIQTSCAGPGSPARCDLANGVDDSLGKLTTVLAGLGGVSSKKVTPVQQANNEVTVGARTLLFYLTRWNETPNDSDVGIAFVESHGLYDGRGCSDAGKERDIALDNPTESQAPPGHKRYKPSFDGCDRWSATGSLGGQYPTPIVSSDNVKRAYVADGKLVQEFEDVALPLFGRRTSVRSGYLVMDILPLLADKGGYQMRGTLSGRIGFNDLVLALGSSQIGQGDSDGGYEAICENGIWNVALPLLCNAQDVMADSNSDKKNQRCNGFSIALGFYASQALVSDIVYNPPSPAKTCVTDCSR